MDTHYFWLLTLCAFCALGFWKTTISLLVALLFHHYWHEEETKVVDSDFNVAIIGAGFSGIGMAIKLKKMGVNFDVFEGSEEVGGTWWANTYPGCACDIQSHLYSYSFYPNPYWTRKYPLQAEILEYLKDVVRHYGIKIHLSSRVKSARFDDEKAKWTIEFHDGKVSQANVLVTGSGALREPVLPNYPGQNHFSGEAFHSSLWRHDCDVSGKRVGIIGTGASAVQIVPAICYKVDQLFVFQRTACWCPPRNDRPIPEWLKSIFNYVPGALYLWRLRIFLSQEFGYFMIFRTDGVKWLMDYIRGNLEKHHRTMVKNDDLAKKLTPTYAPGCKRITPSDEYLPSFNKENVHLVTDRIAKFTDSGITTTDGEEYPLDVVVYATGYSPLESFRNAFDAYNGKGTWLTDVFGDHPRAYLGITVPDFPNSFMLLGPQTGLGHNSIIWLIECEINYIAGCIRYMIENNAKTITVKRSRFNDYQEWVTRKMENKVFHKGCFSWYRNKDGGGANYALWPSHLIDYWWKTLKPDMDDFEFDKKSSLQN